MAGPDLKPEKINSPFQLMAAWFAMLVLLVSALLTGAAQITHPGWASGFLVVFTAILILIVLACVTLMLTKFRPHLQEGKEYYLWLKEKNKYTSPTPQKLNSQLKKFPRFLIQQDNITAIEHSESEITRKLFHIDVSNTSGAELLCDKLIQNNFRAKIYRSIINNSDEEQPLSEHEAIWIGCELPAKDVIKAIKISLSIWSHLKYMHLSNDGSDPPEEIHYQMYIGGSSSSAREMFQLKPWTTEELLGLDEEMSTRDFHTLIRSKY